MTNRIELNFHTTMSNGQIEPKNLIPTMIEKGYQGVALTDFHSVQAFPTIYQSLLEYQTITKKQFKILYGAELTIIDQAQPFIITVLVKNQEGLTNLYELITLLHTKYASHQRLPLKEVLQKRNGLLIGAKEFQKENILFYDYIEITSPHSQKEQKQIQEIINIAIKNHKPVVALNPNLEDTEKQLERVSFLGKELAYHIVIHNPKAIYEQCEEIKILPKDMIKPEIPHSDIQLTTTIYQKAHELYGANLPKEISDRITLELYGEILTTQYQSMCSPISIVRKPSISEQKGILGAHNESILLMMKKVVEASKKKGYDIESRGIVGSSLIAYLLGLTEVDPLPPHYHCSKCQQTIFMHHVTSGFDLKSKECPNCHITMKTDGHNISDTSFLGIDASKFPEININFSDEIVEELKQEAKKLFSKCKIVLPGTIRTKCSTHETIHTKAGMGIFPGGILVIPKKKGILPLEQLQKEVITHFDYDDLRTIIPKLGILGHRDVTMLHTIKKNSKLDIMNIPWNDKQVFDFIKEKKTIGIPEFSVWKGMKEFALAPNNFSECVKLLGLSHGTGTWEENALELLKQGIPLKDLITHREDIFDKLIAHSFSVEEAFEISEFIGKGKHKRNLERWESIKKQLQEKKIETWYITSCEKISYLFPRAHHVSYMMNIYRFLYTKIYDPLTFYKAYLYAHRKELKPQWFHSNYKELEKELLSFKNKSSYQEKQDAEILEVLLEALTEGLKIDALLDK